MIGKLLRSAIIMALTLVFSSYEIYARKRPKFGNPAKSLKNKARNAGGSIKKGAEKAGGAISGSFKLWTRVYKNLDFLAPLI